MIGTPSVELASQPPFLSGAAGVPGLSAPNTAGRLRARRGLVVDLDNTLYPLRRFVQSGFAAVASYVADTFDVPAEAAYAVLSRCAEDGSQSTAFQSLCRGFSLENDIVPTLVEVFRSHEPRLFLGRGARELLVSLRAGGWRIAVLTNGLPAVQRRKVRALGLPGLVDEIIYAEEHAPGGKPAPAAFAEALKRLRTAPEGTVALGDDPYCDIAGARRAGMRTIRLATTTLNVAADVEADIVVDSLADVPQAAVFLLEGVSRHAA